ncbi:MAG: hypothetical protein JW885_00755 [Deltaproteobacteria bacterium]|nr:hypothetical protein [Candidatus Zymogenaceae bacterium]
MSVRISQALKIAVALFLVSTAAVADDTALEDLSVGDSFIRPERIVPHEEVEVKLIVENKGNFPVTCMESISVNGEEIERRELSLSAQWETSTLFYIIIPTEGAYLLTYDVLSPDGSERRTLWEGEMHVDEAPLTGVYLTISGRLGVSPPFPEEGEDVELSVIVENRGDERADAVTMYFYEDGHAFERFVEDIPPRDAVEVTTYWTADEGESYLELVVDPKGEYTGRKIRYKVGRWIDVGR